MNGSTRTAPTSGTRFKIYAITRRDGREMVRWTDTRARKDHHESTERLLNRCELGIGGLTRADAAAFREARAAFLTERAGRAYKASEAGSSEMTS